jgi:hypothetical protein
MIYIGIDNGISGGLVALSDHHGLVIDKIPMPATKYKSRKEVNVRAVHLWLSEVTGGNLSNADYIIEEPNNSRTPSTAYSVASSFHSLRGFFEAKFLPFRRITPQSWQRAMMGEVPTGETKIYALAKANELWPEEKWLASPRCKKPHEGLIDAALIAEYRRKMNL